MVTLIELYHKHKNGDWPDKNSVHSYIPVYEEILAPYRHTAKNVLEIGLMSGESLRMWTEYFKGQVYGIDCDWKPHGGLADLRQCARDGYNVCIGDAANQKDIYRCFEGMLFDVVIEDAAHNIEQELDIYTTLKPYLNKGAIYVVEDVQNIDETRELFENIDVEKQITILDRRNVKGRYDDVLVIIKDKE